MASGAIRLFHPPVPRRTEEDDPARSASLDEILRRRRNDPQQPTPELTPELTPEPAPEPERHYKRRQRRWRPTPQEEIEIWMGLARRHRDGEIPRIYPTPEGVRLEVSNPCPLLGMGATRLVGWRQAQRIAQGEDWREVLTKEPKP